MPGLLLRRSGLLVGAGIHAAPAAGIGIATACGKRTFFRGSRCLLAPSSHWSGYRPVRCETSLQSLAFLAHHLHRWPSMATTFHSNPGQIDPQSAEAIVLFYLALHRADRARLLSGLSRAVPESALDVLAEDCGLSLKDILVAHPGLCHLEKEPGSQRLVIHLSDSTVLPQVLMVALGVLRIRPNTSPAVYKADLALCNLIAELAFISPGTTGNVNDSGEPCTLMVHRTTNDMTKCMHRMMTNFTMRRIGSRDLTVEELAFTATLSPLNGLSRELTAALGAAHHLETPFAIRTLREFENTARTSVNLAEHFRQQSVLRLPPGSVDLASHSDKRVPSAPVPHHPAYAGVPEAPAPPPPSAAKAEHPTSEPISASVPPLVLDNLPPPTATTVNVSTQSQTAAFASQLKTLRAAALASIMLPMELVPLNRTTLGLVLERLRYVAGLKAHLSRPTHELLNALCGRISAFEKKLDAAGGDNAADATVLEAVVEALEDFDDGEFGMRMDIVRVPDVWLPTADVQPPIDHLRALDPAAATVAETPSPEGGQPKPPSVGEEGGDDNEGFDRRPTLFDDKSGDDNGGVRRELCRWLNSVRAPVKVLIEPYSLYTTGHKHERSLRAWAGSVTARRMSIADRAAVADADQLVDMRPGVPRLFVRLLPPFSAEREMAATTLSKILDASTAPPDDGSIKIVGTDAEGGDSHQQLLDWDSAWEPFFAKEYDAMRLARCMSAVEPTPLIELVRRGVCSALENTDLQFLVASRTDLFEFIPPTSTGTDASRREGGQVRFLVAPDLLGRVPEVPDRLREQIHALREERRVAPRHKKFRLTRKIMDLRSRLVIAEHPAPHPLMNQTVLAYTIFDLLPDDSPLQVEALFGVMPRAARLGAVLNERYFKRYPHLFIQFEMGENPVEHFIQRATLPVPDSRKPEDYSNEELLAAVLRPFRFGYRENRETNVSFVAGRIPTAVRRAIEERWGSLPDMLRAHPEVFRVRVDDALQDNTVLARVRRSFAEQNSVF